MDFLEDELLRSQMIQEFNEKMGKVECERHMEELQRLATQEVTFDDIHVSSREVVGAAMRWICLFYSLAGIALSMISEFNAMFGLALASIIHVVDNKFVLSKNIIAPLNWAWLTLWILLHVTLFVAHEHVPVISPLVLRIGFLFVLGVVYLESSFGVDEHNVRKTQHLHNRSMIDV